METAKKGVKIGEEMVYDMENLYGRVPVISQKRDITLEHMLSFKLTPLPSLLFDECGEKRKGTKLTVVSKHAVLSEESIEPDVDLVDGNGMHHMVWPKVGTVNNLLDSFVLALERSLT